MEHVFEDDLDELSAAAVLAAAAEYAQDQELAAVGVMRTALAFADRNAVVPGHKPMPGYERFMVYGGDGCPEVAEFAPVEFGAVLGMSSGAAASLIGEALALRHRLPRVWAAVLSGQALSWRARKIAQGCLSLSLEAAAIVDRRVAGIVNTVTPGKLKAITTAAIWQADPEQAQANAEAAAKTRGVFVAQSDEHGTKRIWVRAAAGDVIRFDATIDDLAWSLKMLGDTDPLDQRRAKAIGWISDPAAADKLIEVARHLARTHPTSTEVQDTPPQTQTTPTATTPATPGSPIPGNRANTAEHVAPTNDQAHGHNAVDHTGHGDRMHHADDADHTGDDGRVNHLRDVDRTGHGRNADHRRDAGQGEHAGSADHVGDADHAGHGGRTDHADHLDRTGDDGYVDHVGDAEHAEQTHSADDANDTNHPEHTHSADHTNDTEHGGDADVFTRLGLASTLPGRLAAIKRDAYSNGLGAENGGASRRRRHTLYVHLTDQTLATGNGVLRVEELGPLLARQLSELLGHDQIVVKPVIDLHDQVSVHAYEIPERIRERVRLRHPIDMFPYGGAEATISMDQDHIKPYDRTGPPGQPNQTSTDNLIPQSRLHHRAKTFGGWRNRRLPTGAIDWTSPHGYHFIVDHTGTHAVHQ
jgi:hypothetical protein